MSVNKKAIGGATLSTALVASQLFTGTNVPVNALSSNELSKEAVEHQHEAFDIRKGLPAVLPTDSQVQAANAFIQSAGTGTKISWNSTFGTPSFITKNKGYLTAPSSYNSDTIARNWLKSNAELFGLSSEQADSLSIIKSHSIPGSGLQPVVFQQTFSGIESANGGRIIVSVNKEGRILSVASNAARADALDEAHKLSSKDALLSVVKEHLPELNYSPSLKGTKQGWEEYAAGESLPTVQRVKKSAFVTANGVRPAYRVLFIEKLNKGKEVVVDAVTGETLFERSLVQNLDPEGLIFENYPGSPLGGTQIVKSLKGDPIASPQGWLLPTNDAGMTTIGNNADTYANWSNFLVPEGPGLVRPVNPLGQFKFPFKDAWHETKGEATPPSYAEDAYSATTNLFYHHNLFHDYFYKLGWTESAGNLQAANFGKGGMDGDPILGLVQAGAASGGEPTYTGRDNAYMLTLPDGIPAWSGMFLWEPIKGAFEGEYADGDFDAGIIYHEYSHALSNRYVAGGESLNSHQAGSMGEAWGDWFGMHYLVKNGLQKDPVVGAYVTGNSERGIRSWALDDAPLHFGDIGFDIVGPEVHADGEIWSAILWHVRESLIQALGKEEGEKVAEHIVMDSMPISAPDPSMDDMRTAILAADQDRYGGEHYDLLWKAFAQRGLGASAKSLSGDDTDPTPSYDHPVSGQNGMLAGKIINASTKKPVKDAKIIIGQYEARTSPVSLSGEKGGFSLPIVSGTYDVTIQARGFGATTFKDVAITAGKIESLDVTLSPNLASTANGAELVSISDETETHPAKNALDDTEGTVFISQTKEGGFTGSEFAVDLAGNKPAVVSSVQVSAFKDMTKGRFSALKDFTVQTSLDGVNWTTVKEGTFTAGKPRPATPDLHYKTFDLAEPVKANFVKFIANNAQDNSFGYVQVAEVQVFAERSSKVTALPPVVTEPFSSEGVILAGNPATGIGSLADIDATGSVTQNEFVSTQNPEPASQGADGYVVSLPEQYRDGLHNITVAGPEGGTHDLDVFFYDSSFNLLGSIATAGANESGVVPAGTSYIYVGLYTGANVPFTVDVRSPFAN
ncbi:M36 family metallopeptidase [Fictibacillus nanhaiensis]|uniref:M36 family metallopeptidase n=1 Tax=Fictibacillus nanhaiensis TaxID=742169 RepID=UPI001C938BAA|nr:M36 family metallopeptidase [Fictibacillus nanhaiensis]MBY6037959.1 M36 family metallopeptidase [Fictibacillus nanhaiensis]